MTYEVATRGVCSRTIIIDTDGQTVFSVRFVGGCAGNTQGVSRLVEGMSVDQAIDKLKGIQCGQKGTSCPDQLALALEKIKEQLD